MNNKNFAFDKINYILMAGSVVIVIIGLILMSGGQSTEEAFDPSIFSARRIKVAPVVCFIGFISMIFSILYRPKKSGSDEVKTNDKAVGNDIAEEKK
jgi:hypothetical protein